MQECSRKLNVRKETAGVVKGGALLQKRVPRKMSTSADLWRGKGKTSGGYDPAKTLWVTTKDEWEKPVSVNVARLIGAPLAVPQRLGKHHRLGCFYDYLR